MESCLSLSRTKQRCIVNAAHCQWDKFPQSYPSYLPRSYLIMCFQFQALAFRPFVETRCWLDLQSDNLSFEKIQIQVRQGGFGHHTLYLVAAAVAAAAAAAAGMGTSATVAAAVVVAGAALRNQA